jgi:hypothetical protein
MRRALAVLTSLWPSLACTTGNAAPPSTEQKKDGDHA